MTSHAATRRSRQAIVAGVALLGLSMVSAPAKPASAAPLVFHASAATPSSSVAGSAHIVPVAWGRGGFRGGRFGVHPFMHRRFVDRDDRFFFRRGFFAGRRFNRPFFHRPFFARNRFFFRGPFFPSPFVFGRVGGVRFGFFP
jgi:hypothetical protein